MFAQFFGSFLLHKGLVTAADLTQAFEEKKNTRMRLGVLAINAGLMTSEQVEHVNVTQQSVDKRFGDLCVELGYLTDGDVERLLSEQPTDYLLLGQTLVNSGVMSNADFESAIIEYKNENSLSNDDISGNQSDKLSKLISGFYHFDTAANARIYTEYTTLLFKDIIRFIGDDFTPLGSSIIHELEAPHIVKQAITGAYNSITCVAADTAEYMAFAERFAKEEFTEVDDFVDATVGEFMNVNNGLFTVNESNEHGIELQLDPQEIHTDEKIVFENPAFLIPVSFSFGEVNFVISNG
ncbi:MAG: chemotaxis protein CheX [Ruminococcus sp.]|nr:chemotaxis protein CheX [Ruminococcus sp.]